VVGARPAPRTSEAPVAIDPDSPPSDSDSCPARNHAAPMIVAPFPKRAFGSVSLKWSILFHDGGSSPRQSRLGHTTGDSAHGCQRNPADIPKPTPTLNPPHRSQRSQTIAVSTTFGRCADRDTSPASPHVDTTFIVERAPKPRAGCRSTSSRVVPKPSGHRDRCPVGRHSRRPDIAVLRVIRPLAIGVQIFRRRKCPTDVLGRCCPQKIGIPLIRSNVSQRSGPAAAVILRLGFVAHIAACIGRQQGETVISPPFTNVLVPREVCTSTSPWAR